MAPLRKDVVASSFIRLRVLWGVFDVEAAVVQTPSYSASQIVAGGDSAAIGSGVGVRRASLTFDRTLINPALDNMYVHFDFLNVTSGSPDDTWITSDYTNLETAIQAFVTAYKPYFATVVKMTTITWHRVGSGVSPPNPAERTLVLATPIAGTYSGLMHAQQVSCSLTFRTGSRKNWGRTYMPYNKAVGSGAMGPISTEVDAIASALKTMVDSAATADMHLVVVSKALNSSLNVESVEVDDVLDVIRRRRPKKSTYRKILP